MRKLFSLIALGALAMMLAAPAQASMNLPAQQRFGEPARVQHERVRLLTRTVHEQLKLRRQQAEAARSRDEDARPRSIESGAGAAIER